MEPLAGWTEWKVEMKTEPIHFQEGPCHRLRSVSPQSDEVWPLVGVQGASASSNLSLIRGTEIELSRKWREGKT